MSKSSTGGALTEQNVDREYGYVAMKDGVRLAYVVWCPKKDGRYPTLLEYGPYAGGGTQFGYAKPFLEAGYAFVGASLRSTGCSEGAVDCFSSPTEGPDGAAVVEWAAAQPWSTGDVGMVGNSYCATTQFFVAAQHPPHLKAIAVSGTEDGYEDWSMVGGMFHIAMAEQLDTVGQSNSFESAEIRIQPYRSAAPFQPGG
jgi:putative CocE/NonD family hydrolase